MIAVRGKLGTPAANGYLTSRFWRSDAHLSGPLFVGRSWPLGALGFLLVFMFVMFSLASSWLGRLLAILCLVLRGELSFFLRMTDKAL